MPIFKIIPLLYSVMKQSVQYIATSRFNNKISIENNKNRDTVV